MSILKKPADELVVRLAKIHNDEIECVLQDYMNEYATYGWDDVCTSLANINAQIDLLMSELKYAMIEEKHRF